MNSLDCCFVVTPANRVLLVYPIPGKQEIFSHNHTKKENCTPQHKLATHVFLCVSVFAVTAACIK